MRVYMIVLTVFSLCIGLYAENIDPYNAGEQYGWGENIGWVNAEPSVGYGLQVASDKVTGWIWAENVGWLNLNCLNNGTCGTVSFGVANDGSGNLSGFAWGENVGWINFDPDVPGDALNVYKVTIDSDGKFGGWAWGENIGWIRFDATQSYTARACVVGFVDLAKFVSYWLQSGGVPANLDGEDPVNMNDLAVFAAYWQDYCPDGWQLK